MAAFNTPELASVSDGEYGQTMVRDYALAAARGRDMP